MVTLSGTLVIVTGSLLVQFVVLALVLYGYMLYRRLDLRRHGTIMALAVFLQLAAVAAIMAPSFIAAVAPEYIAVNPSGLISIISLAHEVTGGVAFALGLYFVVAWRFQKGLTGCFSRRRLMLATLVVWLAALLFGITLYTIFNWNVLMG